MFKVHNRREVMQCYFTVKFPEMGVWKRILARRA